MKIKVAKEKGGVLVVALVLGTLLGLLLGGYLIWASNHSRAMKRTVAWNQAIPVLEAGIEEALGHLRQYPLQRGMNNWTLAGGLYTKRRDLDADSYYSVTISSNSPPLITSQGFVKAPLAADQYISRTVQVTTTNWPMFSFGFAAKGRIDMNGNDIYVDSYDSTDSRYSTDGLYDALKHKDGGDVGTNLGLVDSLNVGNADIWGKVATGPGTNTFHIGKGSVGSAAWHKSGKTGTQPGWFSQDMNAEFPSVTDCPTIGLMSPSGGSVLGVPYQYVLTSGAFQVSQLTGSLYVSGEATLVVKDILSLGGGDKIYIAPGATLKLYVAAPDAKIGGGGILNAGGKPLAFQYYGLPSNKTLSFGGNAVFTGIVYAPDTDFSLAGGGSGSVDFSGASVTKSMVVNGHFSMHFDESVRQALFKGYVVTSWNEI